MYSFSKQKLFEKFLFCFFYSQFIRPKTSVSEKKTQNVWNANLTVWRDGESTKTGKNCIIFLLTCLTYWSSRTKFQFTNATAVTEFVLHVWNSCIFVFARYDIQICHTSCQRRANICINCSHRMVTERIMFFFFWGGGGSMFF